VDRTPPRVVDVTPAPGGDAWLHGSIRFTFDEPIVAPALAVSATLGGVPIEATAAVDSAPRSVFVTVDPAARGVGELAIAVEGIVQDRARNHAEDELATSLQLAAWSTLTVADQVSGAPALAAGKDGAITTACLSGSAARDAPWSRITRASSAAGMSPRSRSRSTTTAGRSSRTSTPPARTSSAGTRAPPRGSRWAAADLRRTSRSPPAAADRSSRCRRGRPSR